MNNPIHVARGFIYDPDCASLRCLLAEATRQGMQPWRDQQRRCIGWKSQRAGSAPKNRLLMFHGNAGCALDRADIVRGFESLKAGLWEVYILEYPGYGARLGTPAEKSFKVAADSAVQLLLRKNKRPLFIAGESIGTGVATYIAARFPRTIPGLFLITPFDTFGRAARAVIRRWVFPKAMRRFPVPITAFLMTEGYDNVRELARYKGRLSVLLARKDEIIPVQLGQNLYDRYSGIKRLWIDPQATHNTVIKPNAQRWQEISDFLVAHI
jgi:pimeloyl-ACP methyl ester carboxylesterase